MFGKIRWVIWKTVSHYMQKNTLYHVVALSSWLTYIIKNARLCLIDNASLHLVIVHLFQGRTHAHVIASGILMLHIYFSLLISAVLKKWSKTWAYFFFHPFYLTEGKLEGKPEGAPLRHITMCSMPSSYKVLKNSLDYGMVNPMANHADLSVHDYLCFVNFKLTVYPCLECLTIGG